MDAERSRNGVNHPGRWHSARPDGKRRIAGGFVFPYWFQTSGESPGAWRIMLDSAGACGWPAVSAQRQRRITVSGFEVKIELIRDQELCSGFSTILPANRLFF